MATTETTYDWDLEEQDQFGDVQEHNHALKLKESGFTADEIINQEPGPQNRINLVLVRDWHDWGYGTSDREWAYATIENGVLVLPERFDGGTKVPQRFHKELERWQ